MVLGINDLQVRIIRLILKVDDEIGILIRSVLKGRPHCRLVHALDVPNVECDSAKPLVRNFAAARVEAHAILVRADAAVIAECTIAFPIALGLRLLPPLTFIRCSRFVLQGKYRVLCLREALVRIDLTCKLERWHHDCGNHHNGTEQETKGKECYCFGPTNLLRTDIDVIVEV